MLESLTTMKGLGLTAAFAVITAAWSHIKVIFFRFKALFIVEVHINNHRLMEALHGYLNRNFKRSSFTTKSFTVFRTYVKPLKRRCLVGEEIPSGFVTFWRKGRPLLFDISQEKSDSNSLRSCRISFFRGFFNLNELIFSAITEINELEVNSEKNNNRFYIRYFYGQTKGERLTEKAIEVEEESVSGVSLLNRKILHWNHNDLGLEESNDALNKLFYPENVTELIQNIRYWYNSKDYLQERGIPWHMGVALYGLPGTGKSSLIKAIAQDFNMPIFSFDLTSMNNQELRNYWERALQSTPCIILFEDIDRLF